MPKIYSIYEAPDFMQQLNGVKLGACITEDEIKDVALDSAAGYYQERCEENGEYGNGSADMIVVCTDDDGRETLEEATVEWCAVRDLYDNGRRDYLIGIGAA